jgi:hypothetical protein
MRCSAQRQRSGAPLIRDPGCFRRSQETGVPGLQRTTSRCALRAALRPGHELLRPAFHWVNFISELLQITNRTAFRAVPNYPRANYSFGSGRFDLAADGTFTSASPSSTISSPTLQMQVSRARWRSGKRLNWRHSSSIVSMNTLGSAQNSRMSL